VAGDAKKTDNYHVAIEDYEISAIEILQPHNLKVVGSNPALATNLSF
jgi:hypothetical protein